MKAHIYHWYEGPVSYVYDRENKEAIGDPIEINNLEEWIEDHDGAVIIYPPSITGRNYWVINITDKTNRFNQR